MDDDNSFLRRRTNYDWNSTIMVSAIISLSFVVILVTILYIYARCVLRRQARRQVIITTFGPTEAPPRSTGLDPSVIASLPIFTMIKQTNDDNGSTRVPIMECSVCLSILEDGEMGRTLPNCKHTFHAECVDKWFISNTTCPVCRAEAEPAEGTVDVVEVPPSAPPAQVLSGSTSRLSSFKRMLSFERSSRRVIESHSCGKEDHGVSDVESQ